MGFQESGLSLANAPALGSKALALGANALAAGPTTAAQKSHIAPTIASETNAAVAGRVRMVFLTHTTFGHHCRLRSARA